VRAAFDAAEAFAQRLAEARPVDRPTSRWTFGLTSAQLA
jgi:hypothetical protein